MEMVRCLPPLCISIHISIEQKAYIPKAEARSSLSAILFRLNAGFVSVIDRFTRGRSTAADYQALLNLSQSSRMEAIKTFSELSQRLSRSSLALVPSPSPTSKVHHTHKRKRSKQSSSLEHTRSKSAPSLTITEKGWVRPKTHRKTSSSSTMTTTSSSPPPPKVPKERKSSPRLQRTQHPPPISSSFVRPISPQAHLELTRSSKPDPRNRKSIMSFSSDSTKLGEIPEHRWPRNADGTVRATTYYPIEPYQEPVKERSRLRKLFGFSGRG